MADRDAFLAEMRKQTALLALIQANLTAMAGTLLDMADRQAGQAVAPNAPSVDLDGPHGDPVVKAKDPRDWSGETMRGRTFSQCPPEYLDMLAARYDYFATKDGAEEKDRKYARLDGTRARGWAARLRAGWTTPVADMSTATDAAGNYVSSEDVRW